MTIKFIDLFSGIGGFHLAFHELGCECVFASEIDKYARQTYEHNFKKISPKLFQNEMYNDDILKIDSPQEQVPDFDVLCAGFPCQPFSQAGYKRGFKEALKDRGNMFFKICEILEEKQPNTFFLENVRHLINHQDGHTFEIIKEILNKKLGYSFYYKVVKASDHGLPQYRPRVFMVGFKDDKNYTLPKFEFPDATPLKMSMSDVWNGDCPREIGYTLRVGGRGSGLNDRRNWDSYLVDGVERRLGIEEGKKMMGLPKNFKFPVSEAQAMKQLGNSVAINAVQKTAIKIINYLNEYYSNKDENQYKKVASNV